ncbi:hypothetical protein ACSFCW_25900 [Yokenella regensburgei]|uniref:hypothetical protein n=1 Tax=Yokenella regensburgei TaxID=158877 RepID=UPI003EDAD5BB
MTEKTPQNKAVNPMNTQTTCAGTTDMARDGELKSRALPQADALKARFKAGSIPLQTDFADLIDLANMGRQAVGGAEGQTGPANGFTLSSEGRLELKPNEAKGISVEQDGITVKVNTNSGLKMTSEGVAINDGLGIEFSSSGQLNLKVKEDGGFSGGPGGAYVINGNGIAVNSSGVNIKLAKGSSDNGGGGQGTDGFTSIGSAGGLALSSNGLSVDAGNGIQIDPKGVSIKLAANSGLSADETNGVKVKVDSGIKIANGAVIIDQSKVLPRGIITMFSGSKVPDGWAFCDGTNGTPDLQNRFIMAGDVEQVGGKSSNIFQGDINSKVFAFTSDSQTVRVKGSTKGHALTADENGEHTHEQGETLNRKGMCHNGYTIDYTNRDWVNGGSSISSPPNYRPYTFESGKGNPHAHAVDLTSESHLHTNRVSVPYYILAFIMKL